MVTTYLDSLVQGRSAAGFGFANNEPWVQDAACAQVGGDLWFPESGGRGEQARRVCNGHAPTGQPVCPVKDACLEYALRTGQVHGIWGGLGERERRRVKVRSCKDCYLPIPSYKNAPLRCEECRAKRSAGVEAKSRQRNLKKAS